MVLGEALGIHARANLDDIISSVTTGKHFVSIERVLQKLRMDTMRVKLSKCQFVKPSIKFLGHVVSHLESIENYPAPGNQKQV